MPNQIPYPYNQNWNMNINPTQNPNLNQNQNILYKLNELEQRIKDLENKLNIKEENQIKETYDFKTSMHMM